MRTAMPSVRPRTVRQCARAVDTAPSRISPTPSGRSGMTPGFGGLGRSAASRAAPWPPPVQPGRPLGRWRSAPARAPGWAAAAAATSFWAVRAPSAPGRRGGRGGRLSAGRSGPPCRFAVAGLPVGGGGSGRCPARRVGHRLRSFDWLTAIVPRVQRASERGPGGVWGQTVRMADQYVPALRWEEPPEGPVVVLLDQTRLPAEEVELVCTDVPALVGAIRRLAVRGAPVLGLAGAYGVALAAARGYDVGEAARQLAGARPTAVNLAAAWTARCGRTGRRSRAAADAARRRPRRCGRRGACTGRTRTPARGWPSTGARCWRSCCRAADCGCSRTATRACSSPAVAAPRSRVVRAVHRGGELRRLWVDETRPLLQGARLTSYEAAREGMPYSVLTDGAAGSLFAAGEVDAVLIGADRIAADGAVANKVGSYPLAVLARYHGVPFVVVAPVTTVDRATPGWGRHRDRAASRARGDRDPGAGRVRRCCRRRRRAGCRSRRSGPRPTTRRSMSLLRNWLLRWSPSVAWSPR